MKQLFIILLLFTTTMGKAQSVSTEVLQFDEILKINNIELELIKVIDSRCPKNVSCITAGQANVIVEVYKDGKFLIQETLIFYPTGTNQKNALLYTSKDLNIKGFNLLPYPKKPNELRQEDYVLQLVIED